MEKPFIVRRSDGEYSTVVLPGGIIETCWFPIDPKEPSLIIGRSYPQTIGAAAEKHISEWEA